MFSVTRFIIDYGQVQQPRLHTVKCIHLKDCYYCHLTSYNKFVLDSLQKRMDINFLKIQFTKMEHFCNKGTHTFGER